MYVRSAFIVAGLLGVFSRTFPVCASASLASRERLVNPAKSKLFSRPRAWFVLALLSAMTWAANAQAICLPSGGAKECVPPMIVPSNKNEPTDTSGWQYSTCREQGFDNCPTWSRMCCAAGGVWAGGGSPGNCGGMQCTGLPSGTWAGGHGFSQETTAIAATELFGANVSPCGSNDCAFSTSLTGWGETIPPGGNCATGGSEYTMGVETASYKRLRLDGNTPDLLSGLCTVPFTSDHVLGRFRGVECPPGSYFSGGQCIREAWLFCPRGGNPVAMDAGAKLWTEQLSDFPSKFGGLQLKYNSFGNVFAEATMESAASYWKPSFTQRVHEFPNTGTLARIVETDGRVVYYGLDGNEQIKTDGRSSRLQRLPASGALTGWLRDDRRGTTEQFDASGRLLEMRRSDGARLLLEWQAGQLAKITDESGRFIQLEWSDDLLRRVYAASGNLAQFGYSAARQLESIQYPNGIRRFAYGSPAYVARHLLSEIRNGDTLMASYTYDSWARVASSAYHVNAEQQAGQRSYAYYYDGSRLQTDATNPLGGVERYMFHFIAGTWRVASSSEGCDSCGFGGGQSLEHDSNGFVSRKTDARGIATEIVSSPIGWATQTREGINTGSGLPYCPAPAAYDPGNRGVSQCTDTCWSQSPFLGAGDATGYGWPGWYVSCASPPVLESIRVTNSTWDSNFQVPLTRTVSKEGAALPESVTRQAINSRGQVIARCEVDSASSTAMNYNCGGSATPPLGVRKTAYDYCDLADSDYGTASCPIEGRLKSVNGARTDVSDVLSYTYYLADHTSCATVPADCAYRKGDLWKITNAVNQAVEFMAYDAFGRVLRQKDVNGVITDLSYGPRGGLVARSVRANADGSANPAQDAVTRIEYESSGEIQRVLQPDGAGLEYCRDQALRLTAVVETSLAQSSRCLGASPSAGTPAIVYTLDAAGNRVREEVRDGGGNVKRLLARQHTNLNRLRAQVNAPYALAQDLDDAAVKKTSYQYDAAGNLESIVDPLSRASTSEHDALNRLITSIQDKDTPAATGEINATVRYEYDARDNLRKVIDPKGLSTQYVYDGLNNQTQLLSPDTGTTTNTYDAAGNRRSQTDARGVVTNYTYDATNRLKTIAYPSDTAKNITFTYDTVQSGCATDESVSKGRLVRIQDVTGQTRMCFDRWGNLRRKIQVSGGRTLTTQYRYNTASRLTGMTYPSGLVVSYGRDVQGRVNSVQLSRDTWILPLVSSTTWLPFGPLSSIQFGNGQTLSKGWDQNYWPDAIGGSALDYDFNTNEFGNIVTVASASEGTQHLGYDRLDRLQEVRGANQALIEAYTYDATGNRLSHQLGTQAATSYSYPANSHRLSAVGASARGHDAVGNTLTGVPGYEADTASYDARNRLVQVGSPSAQLLANYSGRGERVLASQGSPAPALPTTSAAWTTSAGVRGYVYDEAGQVISVLIAGNPLRYEEIVWIDNIPVGRVFSSTSAVLEVHAIHSDHLNTPRALANAQTQGGQAAGTVVWRWRLNATSASGSNAFGAQPANENPDGNGTSLRFDLRFPGQQWDGTVGLNYNYFRDYEAGTGRYVESDPIGLDGGMTTYGYGAANPVMNFDPLGLFVPSTHNEITRAAVAYASGRCSGLPELVAGADFLTNSQATGNSHWHAMRDGSPGSSDTVADAERKFNNFVDEQWKNCTCASLARALHALQDSFAKGHEGFQPWAGGIPTPSHVRHDSYPSDEVRRKAEKASADLIRKFDRNCVPGQCIQ